jgi:vacuolar-type H+-ATPase subunit F/Vma7
MLVTLVSDKFKIAGIDVLDLSNLLELIGRFSLNLVVILILVRWLYFSTAKRKDYLFTYILISSIVFLLCYILESVALQLGFALGLFAIFGIIRYRTLTMPIKEMTYLFLIIGISVINALTDTTSSIIEVIFTNGIIIFITWGLEKKWLLKHESSKNINYEKINLILPEKHDELIEDLQTRTGISKITRIEIGEIDFLKDTCHVRIFFETTDRMDKLTSKVSHNKDNDEN